MSDIPDSQKTKVKGIVDLVFLMDAPFKAPMAEPKGGMLDDLANVCGSNRIILQVFAPKMDCYYELGEIDKADCNLFAHDEEGAAKALNEFTSEKGNFMDALSVSAGTHGNTCAAETELL